MAKAQALTQAPVQAGPRTALYAEAPVRQFQRQTETEQEVDQVLADSFPASDPPPWTPGSARPGPAGPPASVPQPSTGTAREADRPDAGRNARTRGARASTGPSLLASLGSFAGAAGLSLLVPFAILLVGIPVVFLLRLVVEAAGWAVALAR